MEDEAHDAGPAVDPAALGDAHAGDQSEHGVEGEHLATGELAHEESGGMPQLDPSTFDNQIFWLLVSLAAIFLILTRVALPRISATLALRRGTMSSDLAAAESLRAQAREAQAAYDKALADARAEAGRIGAETRATIQAQLDAELAQADARIEAKSAEAALALRQIEAEAARTVETVARDAARAILEALGGQPDEAAVDAAVARQLRG
jgi:F-type H+-transporting ATPase subunit b